MRPLRVATFASVVLTSPAVQGAHSGYDRARINRANLYARLSGNGSKKAIGGFWWNSRVPRVQGADVATTYRRQESCLAGRRALNHAPSLLSRETARRHRVPARNQFVAVLRAPADAGIVVLDRPNSPLGARSAPLLRCRPLPAAYRSNRASDSAHTLGIASADGLGID